MDDRKILYYKEKHCIIYQGVSHSFLIVWGRKQFTAVPLHDILFFLMFPDVNSTYNYRHL